MHTSEADWTCGMYNDTQSPNVAGYSQLAMGFCASILFAKPCSWSLVLAKGICILQPGRSMSNVSLLSLKNGARLFAASLHAE